VREENLGQRTSDSCELEILQLVTRPPYSNVSVLRADFDRDTFKSDIVPR